ncbi:MAG: phage Gp37/Gp68 family protein [Chthonomonadales bacterium]|nr:phage Gp37/Gp68 family protein [Chthonomonadales bacterium]
MASSLIEWTDATWNPVTGCTKISAGCKNCYAERMARRLQAMGHPRYRNGFHVTLHEDAVDLPRRWRRPQRIFVNSMSDLFHEDVPLDFIARVFDTMVEADHHQYQILTKRPERLAQVAAALPWPEHIWMGVTVEHPAVIARISLLRETPARVKFISFEPLLGPIVAPDLSGIHWVIVGGESGPKARPMRKEWVLALRDACSAQHVPFFFKQWGGTRKGRTGRVLEGRTWDEFPTLVPRPMGASA